MIFHDISMTGKATAIFQGFPGTVGTLYEVHMLPGNHVIGSIYDVVTPDWCLNRHLCILPERFAKKDLNLVIVCRKDVTS